MALIVRVYINEHCIIDTHAVRIKGQPFEICLYENDMGDYIRHDYNKGAAKLAMKLLRLYDQRHPEARTP